MRNKECKAVAMKRYQETHREKIREINARSYQRRAAKKREQKQKELAEKQLADVEHEKHEKK